jgi:hypothetical protein
MIRRVEAAAQPTTSEKPHETPGDARASAEGIAPNGTGEGERDDSGRVLSREAAGYRRRLRETA